MRQVFDDVKTTSSLI